MHLVTGREKDAKQHAFGDSTNNVDKLTRPDFHSVLPPSLQSGSKFVKKSIQPFHSKAKGKQGPVFGKTEVKKQLTDYENPGFPNEIISIKSPPCEEQFSVAAADSKGEGHGHRLEHDDQIQTFSRADCMNREKVKNIQLPWTCPKKSIAFAEVSIAEYIFSLATTKLRYLLPAEVVVDILQRKQQRSDVSKDGVDSGILYDILLQGFRGRVKTDKEDPLTDQDMLVKAALEKLFLETISWELDEETAIVGTETLNLFIEVLAYLPHAYEKSIERLEVALKQWQDKSDSEKRADLFSKIKKSKTEQELQTICAWMTEQRDRIEAIVDDMRYRMKVAESESNDIEARTDVEKIYIQESGDLNNEFEYWRTERLEHEVEKLETNQKAIQYVLPTMYEMAEGMYQEILRELKNREIHLLEQDQISQTYLKSELSRCQTELEKTESEVYECRIRTQAMKEKVLEWRQQSANDKILQAELVTMRNATIMIQRWWRWSRWKASKFGKKKKGKKWAKGGKSKGKKEIRRPKVQ